MHKELEKLEKYLDIYLKDYPNMTWVWDNVSDMIYFSSENSLDEFIEIAVETDDTDSHAVGYRVDLNNETKSSTSILKKFSLDNGKEAIIYAIAEAVRLDLVGKDISV
jgi:hypothetical protein